jgi:hypothetical protein
VIVVFSMIGLLARSVRIRTNCFCIGILSIGFTCLTMHLGHHFWRSITWNF